MNFSNWYDSIEELDTLRNMLLKTKTETELCCFISPWAFETRIRWGHTLSIPQENLSQKKQRNAMFYHFMFQFQLQINIKWQKQPRQIIADKNIKNIWDLHRQLYVVNFCEVTSFIITAGSLTAILAELCHIRNKCFMRKIWENKNVLK